MFARLVGLKDRHRRTLASEGRREIDGREDAEAAEEVADGDGAEWREVGVNNDGGGEQLVCTPRASTYNNCRFFRR